MDSLANKINQDIKSAMVAKDSVRLNTLRMLKSAVGYAAIEAKKDTLEDPEIIDIIRKEAKKRIDAAEQFEKGNRPEQAAQERQELTILEAFLPTPYSEDELREAVKQAIASTGATSRKEMGQVIKAVQSASGGRAGGKAVSQMVAQLLS